MDNNFRRTEQQTERELANAFPLTFVKKNQQRINRAHEREWVGFENKFANAFVPPFKLVCRSAQRLGQYEALDKELQMNDRQDINLP